MRPRRSLAAALALAIGALAGGAGASAEGGDDDVRTFTLRDLTVQQELVDLGAAGPSLGDVVAFNDVLKRRGDPAVVGRSHGACTLTKATAARQAFHCQATIILGRGRVEAAGMIFLMPSRPDLRNVLAITGGTGAFAGAEGQIVARHAGQPLEVLTFRVEG